MICQVSVFTIYLHAHSDPPDGDIQLVGGTSSYDGRVEVYHNGDWGTVCHDQWDINDANVVCRQLGYSNATSAPRSSAYGKGSGPIHYDNVQCTGNEARLADCPNDGISENCHNHNRDAGVVCEGMTLSQFIELYYMCNHVCCFMNCIHFVVTKIL